MKAQAEHMAAEIGLTIDNRYEVLGELGRGGMGVVYKASDRKMDRIVAIKVLTTHVVGREEYHERFLREAKSVAKLQHPNIVVVYDYGEHAGQPYMAMEYVEGTPLDKLIASGAPLSLIIKLDYIIQVCHALNYAHQFGIVHRDVKPGNIMVLEGGQRVKLLDFGIARAGAASNLSKSGLAMGTIYYMSPQQTRGQKDLDGRADIFSLGAVLYELLTGTVPWVGESDYEVMTKIVSEPFPPLATHLQQYPTQLDTILERALAKEVSDRYQKAEDMAGELAEVQTPLKEEILAEARVCFEEGDPFRAHDLVSQILRVDTRHGEALEFRNRLQQVAHIEEKVHQLRDLRTAAEQAVGEKRYEEALEAIEQALSLTSSNAELLSYRELIKQELRRRGEIIKKLELAKRAEEISDLASAQQLVDKVLELDPTDTQARMMKSQLLRRSEEEQKQTRLQDLAEQVRRDLSAHRFTAVREAIRQIEALDPSFPPLSSLKQAAVEGYANEMRRREIDSALRDSQQALSAGNFQEALALVDKALAKFPGDAALLRLRSQAEARRDAAAREQAVQQQIAAIRKLRDCGDIERALQTAEAALGKFAGDTRLQIVVEQLRDAAEQERQARAQTDILGKARELLAAGDCDGAIHLLSDASIDFPKSAEILALLRTAREEAGRKIAAANAEKARQRQATTTLQHALASEPDPDAQVRLAQKALESSPGNAVLERLLADARARRQRLADCVEQARVLESAGNYSDALHEWERVRELWPQHPRIATETARLNHLAEEARKPRKPPEPAPPPPAAVVAGSAKVSAESVAAPPPVVRDLSATAVLSIAPVAKPVRQAAPAVAAPPLRPAAERTQPSPKSRLPLYAGAGLALALAVAAGMYVALRPAPGAAIRFEADPAGTVIVVGANSCSAPCEMKLRAGEYELKATHAGYEPATQRIAVGSTPQTVPLKLVASAPRAAQVTIETSVDQADVLVDGAMKGVTTGMRTTLSMLPGAHTVRVEKAGYEPAEQQVTAVEGGETRVQLALREAAGAASPARDPFLIIRALAGATVAVDRSTRGTTPPDGTFSLQVKPGKHLLQVTLHGYEPWTSQVTAKAGDSLEVTAALKPTPAPPAVLAFSASALNIQPGQSSELRWQTQSASEVSVDHGIGSVPASGTQSVSPTTTTTYTLTARGAAQSVQRSITVAVAVAAALPKPAILTFDSGAEKLQPGQSTKLIWATQYATEVTLEPVGPVPASGSREITPAQTTTYILSAKGAGGSSTQSLRITVEAPAELPKAAAAVENPDLKAIRDTIQRYKDAYESMSMDELEQVWPSIPKNKKDAIKESFKAVRAIKIRHECSPPVISGDSAQCECSETISYTTEKVQKAQPVPVLFLLRKMSGRWLVQDHRAR